MLGVRSCQLRGGEWLAVDRDQAPPRLARRILTHLERLHRTDGHLAEHRDVHVLALLEVIETNGLGVLEPNYLADLPRERIEVGRRLEPSRRERVREQRQCCEEDEDARDATDGRHRFQCRAPAGY
jgi:hypothetical protein